MTTHRLGSVPGRRGSWLTIAVIYKRMPTADMMPSSRIQRCGLIEVSCWAHSRRYFYKALDSDRARMGPALLLIAQFYRGEKQARPLTAEDRLRLRQIHARPILDKLHQYLLEIQAEVLPKSPEGRAVRYALKNWTALNRYSEDGDLEIDNTGTERSIRGVAKGSSLCT